MFQKFNLKCSPKLFKNPIRFEIALISSALVRYDLFTQNLLSLSTIWFNTRYTTSKTRINKNDIDIV